ncbi:hypothetical protein [Geopseudomonas aromaticivorans]
MAWRFVRQPNGLLARFSDVVDDFTDGNLTAQDAFDICTSEHGLTETEARRKVQAGVEDWRPWTNGVKGSGLDRWQASLESIRMMHGDAKVQEVERDMGCNEDDSMIQ